MGENRPALSQITTTSRVPLKPGRLGMLVSFPLVLALQVTLRALKASLRLDSHTKIKPDEAMVLNA